MLVNKILQSWLRFSVLQDDESAETSTDRYSISDHSVDIVQKGAFVDVVFVDANADSVAQKVERESSDELATVLPLGRPAFERKRRRRSAQEDRRRAELQSPVVRGDPRFQGAGGCPGQLLNLTEAPRTVPGSVARFFKFSAIVQNNLLLKIHLEIEAVDYSAKFIL